MSYLVKSCFDYDKLSRVNNWTKDEMLDFAERLYSESSLQFKSFVSQPVFINFILGDRSNFVFYDYESGGVDPQIDAQLQCALVRTDVNLNIIDEPKNLYCKPNRDRFPHPDALLITRLKISDLLRTGIPEPDFFRVIHKELTSLPSTCVSGYNSCSYDDEMTRFGFFRNLIPVYQHEFALGNSKMDVYKLVMAAYAIRPEILEWPLVVGPDGSSKVSLRLEHLAKQNHIQQEQAHSAVDDVIATIGIAKKIKERAPDIFESVMNRRQKHFNEQFCRKGAVGVLVSSFAGLSNKYTQAVVYLGRDPKNRNKCIGLNVSNMNDVRALYRMYKNKIDLASILVMNNDELSGIGLNRPPVVHWELNKQPLYWSIDDPVAPPMNVDMNSIQSLLSTLSDTSPDSFLSYIMSSMNSDFPDINDIQLRLYCMGFPTKWDERLLAKNAECDLQQCILSQNKFESNTLQELQQLMIAKWSESTMTPMSEDLHNYWSRHCQTQWESPSQRSKAPRLSRDELRKLLQRPEYSDLIEDYSFWLDDV